MKIKDLISMCLRNLMRQKARTLLTVVGVVVGTCAIVVMISIGVGMKVNQEAMLAEMGDLTIIEIYNYNSDPNAKLLDDAAIAQIQQLEGVLVATPFYQPYDINLQLYAGNNDRYQMYPNIVGVYPEALPLLGYQIQEGSFFPEEGAQPYTMVVGQYAAYNFTDTKKRNNNRVSPYPDEKGEIDDPFVNMLTDKMELRPTLNDEGKKPLTYTPHVVGVLVEDFSRGYETSRGIFMDIDDLKKIVSDTKKANGDRDEKETGYETAKVKVAHINYVESVEEAIHDLGFENTFSMDTIRKPMEEQSKQTQMVLGSLGAISLFVAALGITNTMVMSIYERTREIGIMKVVGCYVRDIRAIFLMEAGCIGLAGGVIGILLSYLISFAMNFFGLNIGSLSGGYYGAGGGGQVSIIPLWLVGMALVFSTCIGLLSGYYPANRAVKISALEAIKHE